MPRVKKALLLFLPAALLIAVSWILSRPPSHRGKTTVPSLPAQIVTVGGGEVTLYFADADTGLLIPVRRQISQSPDDADTLLRELLQGPRPGEKGVSALPEGTEVLGASLADGVLTVNLNRAFEKNFPSSSAASLLAVYSIVNTLTQLPGIQKVTFKIEGNSASELGPLDVSAPLESKPDMIAK